MNEAFVAVSDADRGNGDRADGTSSYLRALNLLERAFKRVYFQAVPMRPSRLNALPSCR